MNLNKLNTYVGWMVFLIATVVYFMTLEETTSLWDCGEYITTAYKLEVGHPPGAPLFMMLGRLFSMFAGPETAAYMVNAMSALSSSFTILFLFWTITLLGKKIATKDGGEITEGAKFAILGSALVGSLAYTFTDSFWFSAVEGEVYAMASLFTAIVFWAILKWDEEVRLKKAALQDTGKSSLRWIILIFFILGLATGVHLLGLLVIPAIAYVIYFNHYKNITFGGFALTGVIGVAALGFIQEGIIPGTIKIASAFERSFVNSFGMPFNTGTIVFFILLLTVIVVGLYFSKKAKSPVWNTAVMSFAVIMIGYSCFAMIVIRSNANTPLDENDPENLVTLHSYLKREQYGQFPLVYGQYFNSKLNPKEQWKDGTPTYLRRFVVAKRDKDLKGFKTMAEAEKYKAEVGGKIVEKYYETNDGKQKFPTYEQNTLFPRMYAQQIPAHKVNGYKEWSGYADNIKSEKRSRKNKKSIGKDGQRVPNFAENINYFFSYQVNYMYWRYFMWNFSGRQNDIQGHGNIYNGNWISGFNFIDSERLGDQSIAPNYTSNNPSNNKFYLLPLILGLIGMIFHFFRARKDAFVVLLLFFFTGLAIVIYLNQKPMEPRERDYAYAGSFYAFAIWIGLSVYALYEAATKMTTRKWMMASVGFGALALVFLVSGLAQGEMSTLFAWLIIGIIAAVFLLIMTVLKKSSEKLRAVVAIVLTIFAPIIMGLQGWDDHDRSERNTAQALAANYLVGSGKNGILFANGDNDTFPLWYLQEVEGKRTDVRVSNLSLLGTDWYTEQMTFKTYDSDPLPIKFSEEQYRMTEGYLDQVMFQGLEALVQNGWNATRLQEVFEIIKQDDPQAFEDAYANNRRNLQKILGRGDLSPDQRAWVASLDSAYSNTPYATFYAEVISKAIRGGMVGEKEIQQVLNTISIESLPAANIKDVSAFMRDEKNITFIQSYNTDMMVVPFTKMYIPVDADTVKAYGYVDSAHFNKIEERVEFTLNGSLLKDNIMMLETIAHNDWKRTIHFTSPGDRGSVTEALRRAGHVAMEGMVYKLTPVKHHGVEGYGYINLAQLYDNLMNRYDYGGIKKKGVLVDYYTRRHTNGYRMQFFVAAKAYLDLEERFSTQIDQLSSNIKRFEADGAANPMMQMQLTQAKSQLNVLKSDYEALGDAKAKAIELINKSLEEIPMKDVIEFGDPWSRNYLPGYIDILYRADADNKEEVANEIIALLDEQMNHILSLDNRLFFDDKSYVASVLQDLKDIESYVDGDVEADLKKKFTGYASELSKKVSAYNKEIKEARKDRNLKRALQEKQDFIKSMIMEFTSAEELAE